MGFKNGAFLGPVQNKLQYNKVKTFLEDIGEHKQKIATGGKVISTEKNGLFIQPTVVEYNSYSTASLVRLQEIDQMRW
jgi:acyl-CoA reductase-like NAD-dependent aldehyde dehydrogenase